LFEKKDRANDLWKSVTSVSSAGAKKGRNKRRGGSKNKDLNLGQELGDGKLQVSWPGLNADVMDRARKFSSEVSPIKIIGVDEDREKRLVELRNQMDKFRSITVAPVDRGFSGSSLKGKSIGEPISYDDGNLLKSSKIT
jgi:small subunit ribosomal protein S5